MEMNMDAPLTNAETREMIRVAARESGCSEDEIPGFIQSVYETCKANGLTVEGELKRRKHIDGCFAKLLTEFEQDH